MLSAFTSLTLLLLAGSSVAHPLALTRREVPGEHSHQKFVASTDKNLKLNNPDNIQDAVFGLLGNAAASKGQGKISDTDCLQQATADQAFTNAKAANDVQGQSDALIYRALERNTGKVGQASVACTAIKAVNPEIAAIQQHQDPASDNAASINKAIVLELAKQIASIGGNPQDALQSGTFAPGDKNDNTGRGNACDDANDPVGCIFTQNLIVFDASAQEIDDAVAGIVGGNNNAGNNASNDNNGSDNSAVCPPAVTVIVTASAAAATA